MTKVLFASNNSAKITEARVFAKRYDIELLTPGDFNLDLDVEETGETYYENSLLKAKAYKDLVPDDVIVIADDSGIEIPALNNEPGIHTRRWNGSVMTDQEIINYCLERMSGKVGDERNANFVAVICVLKGDCEPEYFKAQMEGWIAEEPIVEEVMKGFPFRSLMVVKNLDMLMHGIHKISIEERGGFMTHREKSLQQAIEWISGNS